MEPKTAQKCPQLLREFLYYMEIIRGCSPKTVTGYYLDLSLFLRYIKATKVENLQEFDLKKVSIENLDNATICNVSLSDIYAFLNYVTSVRGNSAVTRARKIGSLRSFYKFICTKTTLLQKNPTLDLDVPMHRRSLPIYLSLDESKAFLQAVNDAQDSRDFCIFTLLLNCGMRLSELIGLNMSDFNMKERTLRLLGKGNKERIIYLNHACIKAIQDYIPIRNQLLINHNISSEPAFLLSERCTRLSGRRVEQIMKKYLSVAGLDNHGYTPHKLRHTAATLMYQYGGTDILILQRILGHSNLSTTEIYTHAADDQVKHAADSSPLADFVLSSGAE